MILKTLKYQIIITLENLITNELKDLSKTVTKRNVELEKDVPKEIGKKNLVDYFSKEIKIYCENNNVRQENLSLYGYEIKSKTDIAEVYFNTDDDNLFVSDPTIMACLIVTKDMPIITATQLDETTVKWSWEANDDIHYLKDEKDQIIYQIPIGINYYIETDLKPYKTYTRYLVAINSIFEEIQSLPCSITLKKANIQNEHPVFEVEKRDETIVEIDSGVPSKLKAFQSGIGDNNDCKLYKSDDISLSRKFNLLNKIYGVRASNDVKHHTIKFTYRYKLLGLQDYLSFDAKFTVRATAQECVSIDKDPDQTLYGEPISCVKDLTFTLDDNTQVANIYLYHFFPGLLEESYKKRYKFTVEIFDTDGAAVVYTYNGGGRAIKDNNNIIFSEHGFFDHKFTVAAKGVKKSKEYIEYYPPKHYDALIGNINGDFEVSPEGLKNLYCISNVFDTSPSIHDKKYFVEFETISPDSAYVQYKWDNQVAGTNYTEKNGDGVTFFSSAIFADSTEHKEFITQIEKGSYIIDDNREHKIMYNIDGVTVDLNAYKYFVLDIVPSNNDITIISSIPKLNIDEAGNIDTPISISCRHLQSAIGKWSPSIHNGYYYYNQNEYFLYSKCVPDGKNLILEEDCLVTDVNVQVIFKEAHTPGEDKEYSFNLKTKEDLLLDDYHYEWADDMVWPKAIETWNDYYQQYANMYEYYAKPFIFDKTPTKYTKIDWEEKGTPNSTIEVYAIAYNEIRGEWYEPVRIQKGEPIPETLQLSNRLLLKFVLKPSRKPVLKTKIFNYECEADWKNNQYNYLSNNVYYLEEILMPQSYDTEGEYVSKFIDLGDTSEEVKNRGIKFKPIHEGDIEFYIMDADSEEELNSIIRYNNWRKVNINERAADVKRFVRYMIKLKPKSKIYSLEIVVQRYEYSNMDREKFLPGFGNVIVEAEYKNAQAYNKSYEYITTTKLTCDMQERVFISDLKAFAQNICDSKNLNINNIFGISFLSYNNIHNFTTRIDRNNNVVYIKSDELIEDENLIENSQGGAIYNILNNQITLSPIPQQYAPIIIYDNGIGEAMTQVFFTDEDYNYILENTEEFESLGFKTLYLKYINIDNSTLKVEIDNEEYLDYTINNNVIIFNDYIEKGKIIKVTYRLLNSFVANYDYEKDTFTILFHKNGEENVEKIRIYYETNKLSSCRQLNNISLNPIYNSRYYGYIYICDYQDPPKTVKIYPASDYIYANGLDTMNVLVQVLDKNQNPVENVKVNIAATKGELYIKNEKTDINGVIHCIYTATNDNYIDTIKAVITENIEDEAKIYNRKL